MVDDKTIATLQEIFDEGKRIVFFSGAGVSVDSGIPDFRSQDGLYNMQYDYPPETIISHSFFMNNPSEFYRFYRNKMINLDAKPNITHQFIAELEKSGKCVDVVTQNIDGLHQMAGSTKVWELHGSILRNYCMKCNKPFDVKYIYESKDIPTCDFCGGMIKPDVVLYEEGLDDDIVTHAIEAIHQANVLVVLGTSLVVYPAAGLIRYFKGNKLVLINKSETPYDSAADLCVHALFKDVFPKLKTSN